ncbi:class A beta-lactamase-related serine hydrolase [Streptomyces sp. AJS327]|uniref:serine hydrolase domain-containing protein n=1 Tax=Streptomyces sp. AJS327 TaxID=2545265 RepID=UPI0015DE0DB9|nr:serine hydrolase domain-containing protein [Streptomyces sp. AJS327]MBA0050136.1 class A beta-lactamase-related serine hydrolase [Streptomyces sp. AJS327]
MNVRPGQAGTRTAPRPPRRLLTPLLVLACLLPLARPATASPTGPPESGARSAPAASSATAAFRPDSAPDRSAGLSRRYAELDHYIRDRMKTTRTPGLAYAVVGPDGPEHQRFWGTDGNGRRVGPDTPFLWGSVAKPIAASAVLTLVQDGQLGLEDRVVDHLPGFRFGGRAHAARVTVRHLLQQTSGLPESATFRVTDCLDADCPRPADRLGALDGVEPLGPPGSAYAYSSANYLVLSAVAEAVTGRPFAEQLRRGVFEPAGMDGAIADRTTARERQLPPGYSLLWGRPAAVSDGVDQHGAGYGYIGGNLQDLAAFAALQLRSGQTADGGTVLTPDSVRRARTEGRLQPDGDPTGYGMGWRIGGLDAPLNNALWHTGASPGYSAMIFLLPERDTALVLTQNLYGLLHDDAVMRIGFDAARILAGGQRPSTEDPLASDYHLTIWGLTALALALLLAAARAALLLRRPPSRGSAWRRVVPTALWCLPAALPGTALLLSRYMSPSQLHAWLPDVAIALWVATGAGAATIVLRVVLAIRSARSTRARSTSTSRPQLAAVGRRGTVRTRAGRSNWLPQRVRSVERASTAQTPSS